LCASATAIVESPLYKEEENVGANSTQAQGVALFLIGFTMAAAGIARSFSVLLIAGGVILLGVSVVLFQKCKPWENEEK
jgi:hypothetical protein